MIAHFLGGHCLVSWPCCRCWLGGCTCTTSASGEHLSWPSTSIAIHNDFALLEATCCAAASRTLVAEKWSLLDGVEAQGLEFDRRGEA
mmetsp:Transcript_46324/g.99004  ORF Transcript_46324/g.99004 Transcript_46324/m.99004 type:complete len:88 (-) Transcript_46324:13-276(-)